MNPKPGLPNASNEAKSMNVFGLHFKIGRELSILRDGRRFRSQLAWLMASPHKLFGGLLANISTRALVKCS